MSRYLLSSFSVSLSLLAALGCSSSSSPTPSQPGVSEATSNLARDTKPAVAPADATTLVHDNAAFAIDAYKALVADAAGKNVFYSPYSVSSALAMTYAGAAGATATEMAKAMHYSLAADKLHPAFDALDLALASRATSPTGDKAVTLHVANALWGEKQDAFGKPFLDTLAVNYGAGVKLVDFTSAPDTCRTAINGWISDQTSAKITDMLAPGTIDSSTRFVLVDAIYFDGQWATQFDPKATAPAAFTTLDGSTVSVPMMKASEMSTSFAQTDAYDAVELAYAGNQVAMDIVVPKKGTFADFESKLTGDSLATIVSGMTDGAITLALPKFKIAGDTISLKTMLQGFGMKTAFTEGADFAGIDLTTPVWIGDVLHKAYVNVDENGTEAAAATAVIGVGGAAPPPHPTPILVDRAFFFVLRDLPTGAILFAGRVTDPS